MQSLPKLILAVGYDQDGIGLEKDINRIYSYLADLPPSKMRIAQQNVSIVRCHEQQLQDVKLTFLEYVVQFARPGVTGLIIAQGSGAALVENTLTNSELLRQFFISKGYKDDEIPQAVATMRQQIAALSVNGSQSICKDLAKVGSLTHVMRHVQFEAFKVVAKLHANLQR